MEEEEQQRSDQSTERGNATSPLSLPCLTYIALERFVVRAAALKHQSKQLSAVS